VERQPVLMLRHQCGPKTSCAVGASPSMKMWFRAASRDGSVYGTSIVGRRLLGGRNSPCDDTDPAIKTDPPGKGITFCRTREREGHRAVSVTDLRRSNGLRQGGAMQTLVERGCGLDVRACDSHSLKFPGVSLSLPNRPEIVGVH